jgi:hypothetical protein
LFDSFYTFVLYSAVIHVVGDVGIWLPIHICVSNLEILVESTVGIMLMRWLFLTSSIIICLFRMNASVFRTGPPRLIINLNIVSHIIDICHIYLFSACLVILFLRLISAVNLGLVLIVMEVSLRQWFVYVPNWRHSVLINRWKLWLAGMMPITTQSRQIIWMPRLENFSFHWKILRPLLVEGLLISLTSVLLVNFLLTLIVI